MPAQQKPVNVTRFHVDHPPFHSAEKDPGRIKFSHFSHLMPGVHEYGVEDRHPMTLADIADPVQRERYRKPGQLKSDDAKNIVQLDCNSCHQLDSGDYKLSQLSGLPNSSLPARSAGAYMLPIIYENQCQACHTIDLEPGNTATALVHRQTPEQLHRTLEQTYTAKVLLDAPHLLEQYEPPQPLPNQFPPEGKQLRELVEEKVAAAERRLDTAVCGKCHYPAPSDIAGLHAVEPVKIRSVWFVRAKFDHHAHRAVDCRACHSRAYPDDPQHSAQASDVLIPKIEVCMKCHAPRDETTAEHHGGARFDCVECHRYHNGAAPLAGLGAQSESPASKLDLKQFESPTTDHRPPTTVPQ
jgi:ribosomal protein L40E